MPLLFTASSGNLPAQNTAVELTSEPGHHLLFRNRYTRVFAVELGAHAATRFHLHRHDYLFVTIGRAQIENDVQGKPPVKMDLMDGQTEFAKGPFAHVIRNLGDTPFRNVTVEIWRPAARRADDVPRERGVSVDSGYLVDILFDTDAIRVSDFKLMPGAVLPLAERRPAVMVAVSSLELRNQSGSKTAVAVHQQPGGVMWVKGAARHTLTNVGQQPARWINVEFK